MDLKHILLRYFLPMTICFFGLSLLNLIPSVQKAYYPVFEKFTVSTLTASQPEIYFKSKPGGETDPNNHNKITVLHNTKKHLQAIIDRSRATGQQGQYDYKGFIVTIDEHFVTPLIFFFSLLIVTPGNWKRKFFNFLIGSLLIMGFAYLTIYFRGIHMVATSGVLGAVDPNTLKGYKVISFIFSSITTITVVFTVWVLVAFRKSDFKNILTGF